MPIRVLLLAPTSVVGGITTWTKHLLKHFDAERVDFHVLDTAKKYEPLTQKASVWGALQGFADAGQRFWGMATAIRKFQPDLVYFTCAPSHGFVARDAMYMLVLKAFSIPHVAHLRGGDIGGFFGRTGITKAICTAALGSCRGVLTVTRPLEREAARLLGGEKVLYLPNMVDDDMVPQTAVRPLRTPTLREPLRIVHVGWQTATKGSYELVRAIALARQPVECDLIGGTDDEDYESLHALITALGLRGRVRLVGERRGESLKPYWQQAELFVFPSHGEGFPNAVVESMMHGVPVLATDVGSIAEMIGAGTDEPAGMLLTSNQLPDPAEIALKIDRLAADPELRQRMSLAGQRRVRDYLASTVMRRLEDLLIGLVGGKTLRQAAEEAGAVEAEPQLTASSTGGQA
jgi:glycosyltransferase involved in cell wall biosynthesis